MRYSFDPVIVLYIANLLVVAFDLFLYYRYLPAAEAH